MEAGAVSGNAGDELAHYMEATSRMRVRAEKAEARLAEVEAERDLAQADANHLWDNLGDAQAERDRLREGIDRAVAYAERHRTAMVPVSYLRAALNPPKP